MVASNKKGRPISHAKTGGSYRDLVRVDCKNDCHHCDEIDHYKQNCKKFKDEKTKGKVDDQEDFSTIGNFIFVESRRWNLVAHVVIIIGSWTWEHITMLLHAGGSLRCTGTTNLDV